jgi:hypothetical protein
MKFMYNYMCKLICFFKYYIAVHLPLHRYYDKAVYTENYKILTPLPWKL